MKQKRVYPTLIRREPFIRKGFKLQFLYTYMYVSLN